MIFLLQFEVNMTGEPPPLLEGDGKDLRVLGFNHKQRSVFVHVLMRCVLSVDIYMNSSLAMRLLHTFSIGIHHGNFLSHVSDLWFTMGNHL